MLYIYILYLNSKNLFYSCVYFFFSFILNGIFLVYFNLEFLCGFLLVVEFTVFFIFILFFFYFSSNSIFFLKKNYIFYVFIYIFFFFFISLNWFNYDFNLNILNNFFIWDDFFEFFNFNIMNELNSFFFNFYFFNSFYFILFSILIFFTTIVCILIFNLTKKKSFKEISNFFNFFDNIRSIFNFNFLRKQNLNFQNLRKPVNRLVKKKIDYNFIKFKNDPEK